MKRERRDYPLPGDKTSVNEEGGGATLLPGDKISANEKGGGVTPPW